MSSSVGGQNKSTEKKGDGSASASKIPAGLETLYALEKDSIKSPLGALILAVHWSIVRAGLRIPILSTDGDGGGDKKYTERLPKGWAQEVPNSPTPVFTFEYVDPQNPSANYQVKVIEIVLNQTAVVTVYRHKSALTSSTAAVSNTVTVEDKTSASTFQLTNFIRFDQDIELGADAESVFYKANELETQIWTELMEPLGLKVIGVPPFQGPYDDKSKDSKKETEPKKEREQQVPRQPLYPDDPLQEDRYFPRSGPPCAGPGGGFGPLYGPPVGGGGYGRSDLDPLGGFGGGMIADPRGFRQPRILGPGRLPPGAVPPGARFDPFGPPMPNNPLFPGSGGGHNWSVPNPDVPPPPGYDDMFM